LSKDQAARGLLLLSFASATLIIVSEHDVRELPDTHAACVRLRTWAASMFEKTGSKPMAVDRRVQRTRTALYDALVGLIRRKAYDAITVEDILRAADVARATFYAHFTSKDDLLERSLDRLRQELVAAEASSGGAGAAAYPPSRIFFEHVAAFRDIPLALGGGRGGIIVREAIDRIVAERLKDAMPPELPGALPRELAIRHVVSALNTTLQWWLERGEHVSAAEAHALFARLVLNGVPNEACGAFVSFAAAREPQPKRRSPKST
jgi:AcrR family transcriptional regulator